MYILVGFMGLICLVWLSRHVEISRYIRNEPRLRGDQYEGQPAATPRVTILVAAKDEEAVIERCVRSLLAQDYPDFELIVIDDRSDDRTAKIVQRLADRDPRCRLVWITELREGWFGKNNAMHTGVGLADGQWFCFTDADCEFVSPRALSVAVRFARDHHIDFLSVLPNLEMRSFLEKVIQPVCGIVMVFWFRPQRVNNPDKSAAYANGAFMLMSREAYEAIGGHEPVKTEVNEDMHMARRAKQVGQRLHVVGNEDLYRCRMYTSAGEIWRGWSRIFYGCFGTLPRLLISIAFLLVMSVLPYAGLIGGAAWCVWGGFGLDLPGTWLLMVSGAAIVAQQSVVMRIYAQVQRHHPLWALGWLVGALAAIGMLCNAILKLGGRKVNWRGTVYSRDRLVKP